MPIRNINDTTVIPFGAPYILAQSAVPVILPSSGSSNASGQITLTTALPYQPSGVVRIYLPAGVVTSGDQGSGAGLYNITFSSTTVGQLSGTVVTANGAYTQTTASDLTLATVTVPGGAMGANGSLRWSGFGSWPNNANNKIYKLSLGGTVLTSPTRTTSQGDSWLMTVNNRNSQSVQVHSTSMLPASGSTVATRAIDTSANQNLTFTGQLAVATDYIILEGYTVEVLPSAT